MGKPVGYGSTPEHSRWQKGQSGNPSGRKKGSVNFKTDLEAELREIIQVTEGGKPKRMTKQRAMLKATMAKALRGDVSAVRSVFEWLSRSDAPRPQAEEDAPLTETEQVVLDEVLNRELARRARKTNDGGDK